MRRKDLVRASFRFGVPLIARILGVGVQGAIGWLTLHYASAEDLGQYYIFVSWTLVFGWVFGFGLPEHVMGIIGRSRATRTSPATYANIAICFSLVLALPFIGIIGLISVVFPTSAVSVNLFDTGPLGTYVVTGVAAALLIANRTVAQAQKAVGKVNEGLLNEFVYPFTPIGLGLAVIAVGGSLSSEFLIGAHLVGYLLATTIGWIRLAVAWPRGEVPSRRPQVWELIRGAGWQWVAVAQQSVFLNLPLLLVPHFGTVADAGVFGLAARIAAIAMVGTDVVISIFGPRFARYRESGEHDQLMRTYRLSRNFSILSSGPILIVVFAFAPQIVSFFGATVNDSAVEVIRILLFGRAIYALIGPVSYFLWMTGEYRREILTTTAALTTLIASSAFFGTMWGVIGVAVAVTLATSLRFVLQYVANPK